MSFVSYAQNREDVRLMRAFAGQPNGFYIDVGANDPTIRSITRGFWEMGWHGINIEPLPGAFGRLAAQRTRDCNLNIGISHCQGTLRFYECVSESSLSTFSPSLAAWWAGPPHRLVFQEHRVPVMTLAQVCEQYVRQEIDFLSIDVEGHEREVISGQDWKRWQARVVIIEDGVAAETGRNCHDQWEQLMLQADYRFALSDGINRLYVRKEDEHLIPLLQRPVTPADDYIPYEGQCLVRELARLWGYEQLGPISQRTLRTVGDWARRRPKISAAAKRLLRVLVRHANNETGSRSRSALPPTSP